MYSGSPLTSMWCVPASMQALTTVSPKNLYGPQQLMTSLAAFAIFSNDSSSFISTIITGTLPKSNSKKFHFFHVTTAAADVISIPSLSPYSLRTLLSFSSDLPATPQLKFLPFDFDNFAMYGMQCLPVKPEAPKITISKHSAILLYPNSEKYSITKRFYRCGFATRPSIISTSAKHKAFKNVTLWSWRGITGFISNIHSGWNSLRQNSKWLSDQKTSASVRYLV